MMKFFNKNYVSCYLMLNVLVLLLVAPKLFAVDEFKAFRLVNRDLKSGLRAPDVAWLKEENKAQKEEPLYSRVGYNRKGGTIEHRTVGVERLFEAQRDLQVVPMHTHFEIVDGKVVVPDYTHVRYVDASAEALKGYRAPALPAEYVNPRSRLAMFQDWLNGK